MPAVHVMTDVSAFLDVIEAARPAVDASVLAIFSIRAVASQNPRQLCRCQRPDRRPPQPYNPALCRKAYTRQGRDDARGGDHYWKADIFLMLAGRLFTKPRGSSNRSCEEAPLAAVIF